MQCFYVSVWLRCPLGKAQPYCFLPSGPLVIPKQHYFLPFPPSGPLALSKLQVRNYWSSFFQVSLPQAIRRLRPKQEYLSFITRPLLQSSGNHFFFFNTYNVETFLNAARKRKSWIRRWKIKKLKNKPKMNTCDLPSRRHIFFEGAFDLP